MVPAKNKCVCVWGAGVEYNHWLILGRTGYIFSNLSCGRVKLMAFVIYRHGNVCCPQQTQDG